MAQVPSWWATVPVGLVAVVGVIADKGEGVMRFIALVTAFAAKLPMGVWSPLLSLVLAMLVWAVSIAKLRPAPCGRRPHLSAEFLSFVTGLFFTLLQQWAIGGDRAAYVLAVVLGLIAGLGAPFLCKCIAALWPRRAAT